MAYERRLGQATTGDLTIPLNGGSVTTSIALSDFGLDSKIEMLVQVNIARKEPVVDNVFAPSAGPNASNDAIGLTVAAGQGTTLSATCTALGY